jgi:transposase-like protein
VTHDFTVEVLYHFNCGNCSNWWSYASTPPKNKTILTWGMDGKQVHCPHCGHESVAEIKRDFFEKSADLS